MQLSECGPQMREVEALRQASRVMVRELGFLEPRREALGISHAQCHVLIELERSRAHTAQELAGLLNLDKSILSRAISGLQRMKLVSVGRSPDDGRVRPLSLTSLGRARLRSIHRAARGQVQEALDLLSSEERTDALRGIELYARALEKRRRRKTLTFRKIRRADDPTVAELIRKVMTEFGADGPGFAIHDPEVHAMSRAYSTKRAQYTVVVRSAGGEPARGARAPRVETVLGGGGFAPLEGVPDTCEIRKMYFHPEIRGLGVGRDLLLRLLSQARQAGYRTVYLETLQSMKQARRLYDAFGFAPVARPMGNTGHFGCDAWYVLPLKT